MDLTAAAPPKVIASDEASDEETWEMDGRAAAPPKVIAFGGISINESYLRAWTFFDHLQEQMATTIAFVNQQRTVHSRPWGTTCKGCKPTAGTSLYRGIDIGDG